MQGNMPTWLVLVLLGLVLIFQIFNPFGGDRVSLKDVRDEIKRIETLNDQIAGKLDQIRIRTHNVDSVLNDRLQRYGRSLDSLNQQLSAARLQSRLLRRQVDSLRVAVRNSGGPDKLPVFK